MRILPDHVISASLSSKPAVVPLCKGLRRPPGLVTSRYRVRTRNHVHLAAKPEPVQAVRLPEKTLRRDRSTERRTSAGWPQTPSRDWRPPFRSHMTSISPPLFPAIERLPEQRRLGHALAGGQPYVRFPEFDPGRVSRSRGRNIRVPVRSMCRSHAWRELLPAYTVSPNPALPARRLRTFRPLCRRHRAESRSFSVS